MEFDQLVKKLVWKRRDDPSAPSIIFSWLHSDKVFYASIKIFHSPYGKGEEILFKSKQPTMEQIMFEVTKFICAMPEPEKREDEKPNALSGQVVEPSVNIDLDDDIPF